MQTAMTALTALDRAASSRDPYRRVARLIHQMARATADTPSSLDQVQVRSYEAASAATLDSWPPEHALLPADLDSFLARKRYAVLSTARPDGRPHAVMIAFVVHQGRLWLPAMAGAVRTGNVLVEPSATLVVSEGEGDDHIAVVVEGEAVVHQDPEALLDEWLRDAWRDRFHSRLDDWIASVIELIPTKVLSHRSTPPSGTAAP